MNYAARNLSNKLQWMTRQLRWKNEVSEIQHWVSVMQSMNELLVAVLNNNELVVSTGTQKRWKNRTCPSGHSETPLDNENGKGGSTDTEIKIVPSIASQ